MNRMFLPLLLVLLSALAMAAPATPADEPADHTAPSYDMKAQALLDLEKVQKKFVDLTNAVPADKLTWRPSADSRSCCRSSARCSIPGRCSLRVAQRL